MIILCRKIKGTYYKYLVNKWILKGDTFIILIEFWEDCGIWSKFKYLGEYEKCTRLIDISAGKRFVKFKMNYIEFKDIFDQFTSLQDFLMYYNMSGFIIEKNDQFIMEASVEWECIELSQEDEYFLKEKL